MAWNEAQKQAIFSKEGNYLLSAGAGSGKTAVLTERIHTLVEEGACSLDQLLVLTFTNKAAHEMKERVRQAFAKDPLKANQVESADITTFDAFALSLVKKYHYVLNLSSDIEIMDEGLLEVEKRKILDEILSERYSEKDPIFQDFVRHYAIKDDGAIVDMTLKILAYAELSFDKEEFFALAMAKAFDPAYLDQAIESFANLQLASLKSLEEATSHYSNADTAAPEADFLASFAQAKDYDSLYRAIVGQSYPKQVKDKENPNLEDGALHKALLASFNQIRDAITNFGDKASEKQRILMSKPYLKIWMGLAQDLDRRLSAYKAEKGAYSFSDIAYLAKKIAEDPSTSFDLRSHYRYVMVDEYQDTSDLQEAFLESLSSGNFFAVGDIKQAIYRFRHANPRIFSAISDRFASGEGRVITMGTNYRSREEVIADVNAIFSHLMSLPLGEVRYDDSQALRYGNLDFAPSKGEEHHLEVLSYQKRDDLKESECEARLIIADIQKKIASGYPVLAHDKANPTATRGARPEDFAILIARKRDFARYQKLFEKAKIPLAVSQDQDLSSQDVSAAFLSLLRLPTVLGKDPQAEKHIYASLMRSYLYQEKDEVIYRSLKDGSYAHSALFETIQEAQKGLLLGSCENGVSFLLDHFPFFEKLVAIGNVKDNYERLASFLSFAKQFDHLGGSYEEFVKHFQEMKDYGVSFALASPDESSGAVRLMSIHASKGLQFPIVYCPDLDAKPNLSDAKAAFGVNRLGFLVPLTLEEGNPLNVLHYLYSNEESCESISERVRLFYVALTRAEEKIILVEKEDPDVEYEPLDDLNVLKITHHTSEKGESLTASFAGVKTFHQFLALTGLSFKSTPQEVRDPHPLEGASFTRKRIPAPEFRRVDFQAEELKAARASKSSLEPLDEGALRYGNELHRYLEVTDFKSKDVSFISDPAIREKIARVLALPIFQDVSQAEIYHEYAFYDEEANVHGSIDLLLVYPTQAVIIDYKAKSVDDPAYLKQLAVYRSYVEKAFGKDCATYLLSIIDARVKRV